MRLRNPSTRRRATGRPPRVFIGLVETAGYYGNLHRALRRAGVDATYVNLFGHPFEYAESASTSPVVRLSTWLGRRRTQTPRERLAAKVLWKSLHWVSLVPLFVWATLRHDVFVYAFKSSFFEFRELGLLRLLRKRIVFVFQGSDIRPSYIDGSEMAADRDATIELCIHLTRRKREALDRIERFAHTIVSLPTYSQLLRRPFVSFISVGIPYPIPATPEVVPSDGSIRILHSPSHPAAKGTPRIRAAIELLRGEGLPIDYVEITSQPNDRVLGELARCDFVVDQLYSDTPMSGFPTEAAAFGKPAIVGNWDWESALEHLVPDHVPPTHRCHPDELEGAIRRLVIDTDYRRDLGESARRFVAERWSPDAVAARYLALFNSEAPPEWTCDPGEIRYVHGVGLEQDRVRELIRGVVDHAGAEALLVDDKPELRQRLLEFARR
jgi:hypothetical protein